MENMFWVALLFLDCVPCYPLNHLGMKNKRELSERGGPAWDGGPQGGEGQSGNGTPQASLVLQSRRL